MGADGAAAREEWRRRLRALLEERRNAGLRRDLQRVDSASGPRVTIGGREYLQFCTNNYLGLATDPEVVEAGREALAKYGGRSRRIAAGRRLDGAASRT